MMLSCLTEVFCFTYVDVSRLLNAHLGFTTRLRKQNFPSFVYRNPSTFIIKVTSLKRLARTHATQRYSLFLFLARTHLYSSRERYSEAFIFHLPNENYSSNHNFGPTLTPLKQDWDLADANYLVSHDAPHRSLH